MELITRIHGILFVVGDEGITRQQLANTLQVNLQEVDVALEQLTLNLQYDELSPIEVVSYNQKYQLVTKQALADDVEAYAQAPFTQNLSRASVETLAIIAYRQPITRMAIDEIRGVQSAGLIQKLIGRNLVKEIGRIDAPGRPVLYSVTDYFMDYFGLKSLDDLPEIEEIALNAQLATEELFNLKEWNVELFEEEEWTD